MIGEAGLAWPRRAPPGLAGPRRASPGLDRPRQPHCDLNDLAGHLGEQRRHQVEEAGGGHARHGRRLLLHMPHAVQGAQQQQEQPTAEKSHLVK